MKRINVRKALWTLLLAGCTSMVFINCNKNTANPDNGKLPSQDASRKTNQESGKVATDWYQLQLRMILQADPGISPLFLMRSFGYIGIGLYESVRPGMDHAKSLAQYLKDMPAMPEKEKNNGYSWPVSANAALGKLVRYFYPAHVLNASQAVIDSLENAINEQSGPAQESAVFQRSRMFGLAIADAIIEWSKTDNNNFSNTGYVPPVFQGAWEPTTPGVNALSPYFGNDRLFIEANLQSSSDPFPYSYSEMPGSAFYSTMKDIYDVSKTLTEDEKNIARLWNDVGVGVGYTPTGHNVHILTQILTLKNADLAKAALAYAKTGIALHDAGIVCWKSKYTYHKMRPVTYIRKVIDPGWTPLIGTPPHPEYPAAHSVITSAFMETMTGIFGENYSFTDHTYPGKFGGARYYSSFAAAAMECGLSRRFGGIHLLPSIHAGLQLGREVGQRVNGLALVK